MAVLSVPQATLFQGMQIMQWMQEKAVLPPLHIGLPLTISSLSLSCGLMGWNSSGSMSLSGWRIHSIQISSSWKGFSNSQTDVRDGHHTTFLKGPSLKTCDHSGLERKASAVLFEQNREYLPGTCSSSQRTRRETRTVLFFPVQDMPLCMMGAEFGHSKISV